MPPPHHPTPHNAVELVGLGLSLMNLAELLRYTLQGLYEAGHSLSMREHMKTDSTTRNKMTDNDVLAMLREYVYLYNDENSAQNQKIKHLKWPCSVQFSKNCSTQMGQSPQVKLLILEAGFVLGQTCSSLPVLSSLLVPCMEKPLMAHHSCRATQDKLLCSKHLVKCWVLKKFLRSRKGSNSKSLVFRLKLQIYVQGLSIVKCSFTVEFIPTNY